MKMRNQADKKIITHYTLQPLTANPACNNYQDEAFFLFEMQYVCVVWVSILQSNLSVNL